MKPLYKLGTLVQFENPHVQTGIIEGQITREDGMFYEMKEGSIVAESDIMKAFRPIILRKRKQNSKKAKAVKETSLDA